MVLIQNVTGYRFVDRGARKSLGRSCWKLSSLGRVHAAKNSTTWQALQGPDLEFVLGSYQTVNPPGYHCECEWTWRVTLRHVPSLTSTGGFPRECFPCKMGLLLGAGMHKSAGRNTVLSLCPLRFCPTILALRHPAALKKSWRCGCGIRGDCQRDTGHCLPTDLTRTPNPEQLLVNEAKHEILQRLSSPLKVFCSFKAVQPKFQTSFTLSISSWFFS